MGQLNVTVVGRSGDDITSGAVAADVGGSDKWQNTGKEFLLLLNGSGSSYTATFPIAKPVDGQTVPARTVTVAAGHYELVGPFPPNLYNDAQGNATVQHSATTTIKLLPLIIGN
jgi:hypothetical protein